MPLLQDLTINDHFSVARGLPDIIDLASLIQEQSAAKRNAEEKAVAEENTNKKPKHSSGSASSRVVEESYWESPEAKKLFLGNSNDDHDVVEVLQQQIQQLQQVNRAVQGWRNIVDKHDKDNLCSIYDVFIVRQRCSILCLAFSRSFYLAADNGLLLKDKEHVSQRQMAWNSWFLLFNLG